MLFKAKAGIWIRIFLLFGPVVSIFAVIKIIIQPEMTNPSIIALIAIVIIFPLSILFFTRYTINEETLIVQCSFLRWRIPINEIKSIEPTSDPSSSAALSLDRLRITYSNNRTILISPKDKEKFIEEINKRKA